MSLIELVKENVNALIKARQWSSHKPLIKAGRLTNGTLGRIRKDGENIKLSTLEDLAEGLGVRPIDLISHGASASNWRKAGEFIANQSPEPKQRELLLDFLTAIETQLKVAQRFAESIPDIADR